MLIVQRVCTSVCVCTSVYNLLGLAGGKKRGVYALACVFRWAELDLGPDVSEGIDAWRNLVMRLINSLATQSRFIK